MANGQNKTFTQTIKNILIHPIMLSNTILKVLTISLILSGPLFAQQQKEANKHYKVAVVDLMILKRQKLGAFQLTKDIGADGVEVDMGGLGNRETFDNALANDSI